MDAMSHAPEQDALLNSLRQLLRPLAQLALARGLPYGALDELLRAELVAQARRLHAEQPEHGLVSRISTATGLTRREVGRLLSQPDSVPTPPHGLAGELFARWQADPKYRQRGRPRVLPRCGPAPSFEALAQAVTRDVHPRSLLDELCRLGLATWDQDTDRVTLRREAFVPRADRTHMLTLLGDNVGDHLQAAVVNVLGGGDAHFEQAVYADELSAESVQALRPQIAAAWDELFQRMVPLLQQHIDDDHTQGRTQDQRVRIGFYSFAAPMAGTTSSDGRDPPQDAAAPARSATARPGAG